MTDDSYHNGSAENEDKSHKRSIDSVLESIPVGWFHYRLAIICGAAFMADSMEVTLLSYISTCAGDDWDLSDSEKATITSLVFAGALLGSLFWGRFADIYGRKMSFIAACIVISASGLLSAASPSYPWLLTFRALVGFGIGGSTVPFDLLAEFLPVSHRGSYLIYIEYFWTLGSLFVNGVAWMSMSSLGWRFLTYITAVPVTLALIFGAYYLPESPRWLMVMGRRNEAEKILINAANDCNHILPAFSLVAHHEVEDSSFLSLIRTSEMRRISLPLGLVWLCFGLSYYGVILLVSRLYSSSDDDGSSCSFDYEYIFINSSAEIVGVTIAGFVIDNAGRIRTQCGFYLMGSVMMMILGFNMSTTGVLVIAWLARLAAMASSCATWVRPRLIVILYILCLLVST